MGMRVLAFVCLLLVTSAFAGVLYQTGDVPTDESGWHGFAEADGELRWNGPEGFAGGEPRAVFAPSSVGGDRGSGARTGLSDTDDASTQNGGSSEGTGVKENESPRRGGSEGGVALYFYGVAVVLVLSAAAVAYRAFPGSGKPKVPDEPAGERDEATSSEEEERDEKGDGTGADESVSDDVRVLRMIETEGGSMKQKHLVEETGWSEAKVSKLTSSMEEDGEITKIRLGRENILKIKDEEEEEDEFGY